MCTLVIIHNVNEKYPLIVGANRDEYYDRQSEEPDLLQVVPIAIVAPRDVRSGGTWIGAAQGGWFVGLTNQDDGFTMLNKKSRGDVVRDCLLLGDHRAVTKYLVTLNPKDYNPFNLVFGRPDAMFLCRVHHDRAIDLEIIPDGITVISNDCTDSKKYKNRETRVMEGARSVLDVDSSEAIINKLEMTLSTHVKGDDPYQSVCIHDDASGFGTRSSSIVFVSGEGGVDYYHSEGHPCVSAGLSLRHSLPSIDSDGSEHLFEIDDDLLESID